MCVYVCAFLRAYTPLHNSYYFNHSLFVFFSFFGVIFTSPSSPPPPPPHLIPFLPLTWPYLLLSNLIYTHYLLGLVSNPHNLFSIHGSFSPSIHPCVASWSLCNAASFPTPYFPSFPSLIHPPILFILLHPYLLLIHPCFLSYLLLSSLCFLFMQIISM